MKTAIATICAAIMACSIMADPGRQTFRDAQGRNQGTATTDRSGKTTYRDAMGRNQGTATTDRSGKTTYRDSMGRIQGTKQ